MANWPIDIFFWKCQSYDYLQFLTRHQIKIDQCGKLNFFYKSMMWKTIKLIPEDNKLSKYDLSWQKRWFSKWSPFWERRSEKLANLINNSWIGSFFFGYLYIIIIEFHREVMLQKTMSVTWKFLSDKFRIISNKNVDLHDGDPFGNYFKSSQPLIVINYHVLSHFSTRAWYGKLWPIRRLLIIS